MTYYIAMSYVKFFALILVVSLLFDAFQDIKGRKKLYYVITVFFIFFVVMGFRRYSMGSDTASYYMMFRRISGISNMSKYVENSDVELGYLYYNRLLSYISDNPRILFVVTAAIMNFSFGFFVYRNISNPGAFCCLFVSLMQFDFMLSAMRQSLAVVTLIFAIDALIHKRKWRFIVLSFVATIFHNAAWIMVLMIPFLWKNDNIEDRKSFWFYVMLFGAIIACTFFFDNVWGLLLRIFPKYDYYTNTENADGEPRLAIFLKIIVFLLLYVVPKVYRHTHEENRELYNVSEKLSILHICMYAVSSNATALARLAGCFSIFALGHFSNSFKSNSSSDKLRLLLVVLGCSFVYGLVIVIYKTPDWQTTYPIMLQIQKFW